jgi:hypothetical protein
MTAYCGPPPLVVRVFKTMVNEYRATAEEDG